MAMKKWIFWIAIIGASLGGYFVWSRQEAHPAVAASASATTATAELRTIVLAVNCAGDIGPADMVSVRPEINGRIAQLPVDIGDHVKQGDLLCALDDRDLQTERSSQLVDIEGAKLQLEQARRNYERSQQLYADNLVSKEEYQTVETTYALAQNALERAQRALSQVEDQLSKTRIVAPFDCTVLTRPVSVGQAVSGSGGYNSGTEIMTIANLQNMIVTAHLNQADVVNVKRGQKVDVRIEAVPGLEMTGTVERIAPQATVKNNIKGFETQIQLANLDPRVRPGMTATMTIPVATAENTLAIPISAVFTDQGRHYAYVKMESDQFQMRPVQIGISDYEYAQILNGLSDGEVVSLIRPDLASIVQTPPTVSPGNSQTNEVARNDHLLSAAGTSGSGARTNRPAATTL